MYAVPAEQTEIHFMVVNADPIQRRLLTALLRELGYLRISEAEDGAMALRAFKVAQSVGAPIDLVITDSAMPILDGVGLLRRMRNDDLLQHTPVLMVTAHATREAVLQAAQAGADSCVVKPFTTNKLRQKIDALLQKLPVNA